MRSVLRSVSALLVAAALVVGCGAERGSESGADDGAKPTAATPTSTGGSCGGGAAPRADVAEITDVIVDHAQTSVAVDVGFTDIDPALEQEVSIHLATPTASWSLDIIRSRARARTMTFFAQEPPEPDLDDLAARADECVVVSTAAQGEACRVRGQFDLDRYVLHATVPRSCMSNPAWVRVGVDVVYIKANDIVGSVEWNTGGNTDSWLPPFGPEVAAATGAAIGCQKRTPRVQDPPGPGEIVVVGKRPCIA